MVKNSVMRPEVCCKHSVLYTLISCVLTWEVSTLCRLVLQGTLLYCVFDLETPQAAATTTHFELVLLVHGSLWEY